MSKSATDPRSRVLITDGPDEIRKKLNAALTDSINSVTYDPQGRPAVSNLLQLLSLFEGGRGGGSSSSGGGAEGGRTPEELALELEGSSLKVLKTRVADAVVSELAGVRDRFYEFMERDGGEFLDDVEEKGAAKARENAEKTMRLVRSAVGI